jgi:hypothetical protein
MNPTRLANAQTTSRPKVSPRTQNGPSLKYLIIAVVAALVFVLVYRRVRPYLQLMQKVVSALNQEPAERRRTSQAEHKLVRCVNCGTWIPSDKATRVGSTIYCSTECLEKRSASSDRKLAG